MRHVRHILALAAIVLTVSAAPTGAQTTPDDLISLKEHRTPVDISDLAPGDWFEWTASVTNITDAAISVAMTFHADQTSPLTTNSDHGLQALIDVCPQPWEPHSVPGGAWSYTCPVTPQVVGPEAPVAALLTNGHTFNVPAQDSIHVRATVRFPSEAGNDFENLQDRLNMAFSATVATDPPPPTTTSTVPSGSGSGTTGGTSTGGDTGVRNGPSIPLPRTGVEVAATIAAGLALLAVGLILTRAGRHSPTERATQ